ncbi:MAG: putative cytoplasmic protein, partial [bacterium]|nr:putative cytoplasmic protein [bacterium]
ALLAMGRALASLRAREVLVVGSGTVVHNLRAIGQEAPWARAFDAWFADAVARHDLDALAEWRIKAPDAAHAHPPTEHFDPFLVAMGATEATEPVTVLHDQLAFGSLSMRTFAIGA